MTQEMLREALASCKTFKQDLTPMRRLMAQLGNPQDRLQFIHVAGTNGKGSTCAMLASVLRQAGYRTGLFVSPYILEFRERMQCDGAMIPEEILCSLGEQVIQAVRDLEQQGIYPTEFDAVTAIGFLWFAAMQCDVVVLEVGMGGRVDSTNVILPETVLTSVITSISLDHVAILGDTDGAIAAEKAGICKQNRPIVVSETVSTRAFNAIEVQANQTGSPIHMTDEEALSFEKKTPDALFLRVRKEEIRLPLPGIYQMHNVATVLSVLEVLQQEGWAISWEAIRSGLEQVQFPARMELLNETPLFWIDGAHNPEGVEALLPSLEQLPKGQMRICLHGMLKDKNCGEVVRLLSPSFDAAVTVGLDNPRALSPEALAELWRTNGTPAEAVASVSEAIDRAVALAGERGAVVCCGSLYLCAAVRPIAVQKFKT